MTHSFLILRHRYYKCRLVKAIKFTYTMACVDSDTIVVLINIIDITFFMALFVVLLHFIKIEGEAKATQK